MKDVIRKIKDSKCHAITFLPSIEEGQDLTIQGLVYHEEGDKIGGSTIGNLFDIITFRDTGEKFDNMEHYEAILVCPYTYGEKLIKEGWFGMIALKTSTSHEIVDKLDALINELVKAA